MTNESEFQAERLSGLGGSDIGDLFSIEPYGCERRLLYEKRNIAPDYEVSEQSRRAMRRGTKLEDVIADEYAEVAGRIVKRVGHMKHRDFPFLAVHMDRLVWRTMRENPGYLEIKAPGYGMFKKIKKDGLPWSWQLQLQEGMLVAGMSWGSFCVMDIPNWTPIHFDVDADFEIQEMIIEKACEFWPKVENGPFPDKFPPDDSRCRKCEYRYRCHGNAVDDNQMAVSNNVQPDPEIIGLVNEILEYQDIEDEAHVFTEDAKARLKTKIGPQCNFRVPGASVNNISFDRNGWDTEALNAYMNSNPSIAKMFAKFRKKTPQSQLRIERI